MDPFETDTALESDPYTELTRNFTETSRILFSAGGVTDTLVQIVSLAVVTIDGCDFAGLFVMDGKVVTAPVTTDPIVGEIDAFQNQAGEGPCLDAIAHAAMVYADDLETDGRWPAFGPRAAGRGVRSALALPLIDNGAIGAINLYARFPAAFGVLDRAKGVVLASLASVALSAAHTFEDEERRIGNLHSALSSREVIGQAQGILMERERIAADQAFDILRRASQYLNIKLREVAQALVDTGEKPDSGPDPRT
jgi:GAF domain-containing protein